jgi:hypothetical protein
MAGVVTGYQFHFSVLHNAIAIIYIEKRSLIYNIEMQYWYALSLISLD